MKINKISKAFQEHKKKVAAYVRVSTLQEEQEESFTSQKEFFDTYIRSINGWEYMGIYADEGKTGLMAEKRPEFMRMIQDALDGKIDIILCKSISRFGRSSAEVQEYVHMLKASVVEVKFLKENLSSFDAQAEVVFNFMSAVAEEQSRSISDNVKWAYKRLAEQGIRHIGNNRVVGYDEVDGTLEPNSQAWIPKLVFTEYAAGKPVKDIIKLLNKRGAKRLRSKNSYNPSTIYYILSNEMYVGDRRLQKEPHTDYRTKKPVPGGEYASYYIENDHEGIIGREMWETVQARLKLEKERKANGVYSSSREHFMHGKLFCGDCGMPLTRRTICYRGEQQKVWKCKGRMKDSKSCKNDVISEEDLFKALSEHLGIKWNGVEAVTERTFEQIKKVVLFNDGRIEIEIEDAA